MRSVLCKVGVTLLLVGLGVMEYWHHAEDSHAHALAICTDPGNPKEDAKALFQQHLYSHR